MRIFRLGILLLLSLTLHAQHEDRQFVEFIEKEGFVEVHTTDGFYRIQPFNEKIVETSFVPKNEEYDPVSHAVVLEAAKLPLIVVRTNSSTHINTTGISIEVRHQPFQISYYYQDRFLISERAGYTKKEGLEVLDFNLESSEVLYGGGARALGMNRRGHRLELYNKAHYGYETHSELMNFTIPLVLSSKMYAVHFDNPVVGFLDLDSTNTNTLAYETEGGRKTYQVVAGDSWLDLIEQYTALTGKQPLPPRWAFGNFSSRFGYHSQSETLSTVQLFIDEEIPVDAVILDLYWFGKEIKGTMGNLEFHKDSFPDPRGMIRTLKEKGVQTILITEPFVLTTSNRWQEAVDKEILGFKGDGTPYTYDFYFGNTGIIDVFNPTGRKWFWDIYKKFTDYGVAGWWGDLGEPEMHPKDLLHSTGTANEVHNIYGHEWAKLIYEGYKTDFPDQRPFILMRAGYSGSQYYGMIPWSGDVNRTWGGLQSQMEISLQMSMQGMAYMHSDLGGFAGPNLDDELYARWLQYGVFQPIYRPHAQEEVPSEPVFRADKPKALAKEAIKLRYKLLPYNYTLGFENNQNGVPLMRPLFFEEPENETLLSYDKTYLWGNDFLVSPVVHRGISEQEVVFPAGSNWFDFYSKKKYSGGQKQLIPLNESSIPTYVRGGALIPMTQPINNTGQYSMESIELHYYFDDKVPFSEGSLYHDDGISPQAFEAGKYELLKFKSCLQEGDLQVEIAQIFGENWAFYPKKIAVYVHNLAKEPRRVIGHRAIWNDQKKLLKTTVHLNNKKTKRIKIKL